MLSLCLEIKAACISCGSPLTINAFTDKIFCSKCNSVNTLSHELWSSLLKDNSKEILEFKEGEGQPSKTFTGQYQFDLMYGRQYPRCTKCKTNIPEAELQKFSTGGIYKCAKCSNEISIRPATGLLISIIPEAKYIIGEDANLLSSQQVTPLKPVSAKPILYTCPSCAGSLEIDGTARLVVCKYCDSKVYLPDDLWFTLHPVTTAKRWYITFDEKIESEKLPEWYYLSDVTIDRDGNLYFATADDEEEKMLIWSMTPDFKKRWMKEGLQLNYEHTGLAVTKSGNLLVWETFKRSLLVLSCKDGSEIKKIKGDAPTDENPFPFNLKGCESLISDSDETILALVNNTLVRFNPDGTRAPLWGVYQEGEHPGFFSRLLSGADDKVHIPEGESEWAPGVHESGSKPKRMSSSSTKISIGWDDSVYFLDTDSSDALVAKYDREGKQIWRKPLELENVDSGACADANGNVYIIGADKDYKARLIRISPDGKNVEVLVKDITEGGTLRYIQDDKILISTEGIIYIMNYWEQIRVLNPDLSVKYISPNCKKDDDEKLNKFKSTKDDL